MRRSEDGFEVNLASPRIFSNCCVCADRNLAASAEMIEQGAFAGGSGASGRVVEESEMLTHDGIAFTYFDAKRALSGGWAHDFCANDFFEQLRLAQAFQTSGSQDDGVVFSLLEFPQARVDIAA